MKTPEVDSLAILAGAPVLVRSSRENGNPPTGMRGTIEIAHDVAPGSRGRVRIALDYPQMFGAPAHHRTIVLTDEEIGRLLASANAGTYAVTVDADLSPTA